jgi:hypothetical protein
MTVLLAQQVNKVLLGKQALSERQALLDQLVAPALLEYQVELALPEQLGLVEQLDRLVVRVLLDSKVLQVLQVLVPQVLQVLVLQVFRDLMEAQELQVQPVLLALKELEILVLLDHRVQLGQQEPQDH